MRNLLLGVVFAGAAASAHAAPLVQATITCGGSAAGWYSGGVPTLNITYSPGTDAGIPGLFWVGILTADQKVAAALDLTGTWLQYQGGLYPPNQRFDNGLPGTVTASAPLPADSYGYSPTNTSQYVGLTVYVGHGAYTSQAAKMVADRRSYLNSVRAKRIADGTWSAEYDDDTKFIWSLIQKDMIDRTKWGAAITIPFVECAPGSGGQG